VKKSLLVLILLLPSFALAEKSAPNPGDYTVAVHVQTSSVAVDCSNVTNGDSVCFWNQHLKVTIDGKEYELVGNRAKKTLYVLRSGDYKAKILKEDTSRNYEYERSYEFLFADGTTGDFQVMGESE
jgi:hypothetical protein